MPESAEVRLTTEFLDSVLRSKIISEWNFVGGKYTDNPPEGYSQFDNALPLVVQSVQCKGKFIYFTLQCSDGKHYYILHSLMMTGRWQREYDHDYSKWYVELEDGETLWFRNPRSLATLVFTDDVTVLNEKLESLGPDILREEFTLPVFKELAKKYSKRNITSFLMDQSVISGCGNYIKAEALYYAQVSPLRKISDLSEREIEKLYQGLRIIPIVSYNHGGVSMRDYADQDGKKGSYGSQLKVYGNRDMKITKTPDGRTTYWDPSVQN